MRNSCSEQLCRCLQNSQWVGNDWQCNGFANGQEWKGMDRNGWEWIGWDTNG